jgi:hypothetical protein
MPLPLPRTSRLSLSRPTLSALFPTPPHTHQVLKTHSLTSASTSNPHSQGVAATEGVRIAAALPPAHAKLTAYLMRFLARIAVHEAINKMSPSNLGIVFAPNILKPRVETYAHMLSHLSHFSLCPFSLCLSLSLFLSFSFSLFSVSLLLTLSLTLSLYLHHFLLSIPFPPHWLTPAPSLSAQLRIRGSRHTRIHRRHSCAD